MAPSYVRLSGEIADQAILDNLKAAYPNAEIAHAFASTEAGVGFDVRDGLAGFPASYVGQPGAHLSAKGAEIKVEGGTIRIRSTRTASRYLGSGPALGDRDGFVDTGDMVERVGDRYYFLGRREGVINVGGQKVFPGEVEAILETAIPGRAAGRRASAGQESEITGAIVAADVVLQQDPAADFALTPRLSAQRLPRRACCAQGADRAARRSTSLKVSPSGKLLRHDA